MGKDNILAFRVNFTMPNPEKSDVSTEVANKVIELFKEKRELGILRHWLMGLACEAAKKELEISTFSSDEK